MNEIWTVEDECRFIADQARAHLGIAFNPNWRPPLGDWDERADRAQCRMRHLTTANDDCATCELSGRCFPEDERWWT